MIDDHSISARVRSALANDPQLKYAGVEVDTFKGTVQLSRFVEIGGQKNHAATPARRGGRCEGCC